MGRDAWSAAVLSSWSCAAWFGHHVPRCHVPGVVPGLVTAAVSRSCPLPSLQPRLVLPQVFISQTEAPSLLPEADLGPAPCPHCVPQGCHCCAQRCQPCAPGVLPAPGPGPTALPKVGSDPWVSPCHGDTLCCSGRCGPGARPIAGSCSGTRAGISPLVHVLCRSWSPFLVHG